MSEGATMAPSDAWRGRFEAVARAQSRYLYLLLVFCVFYAALASRLGGPAHQGTPAPLNVPLVDIEIDGVIVLASGPAVIGLLLRALLGTFPALQRAYEGLYPERAPGDVVPPPEFEQHDTAPTAVDFIVYTRDISSRWRRWGLLAYPVVLTSAYAEAWWVWGEVFAVLVAGRTLMLAVGAVVLLSCVGGLASVWGSKVVRLWGGRGPA